MPVGSEGRGGAPGVRELASDHRSGRRTVRATAESALSRLDAVEPGIHAFAHVDPAAVLARADVLDALPQQRRGPLHGVPIGIKDIIDTVDAPTEYGSAAYAGHRPRADATMVARLRAAGAVILGKTVTTEFALFTPGPTRNPHDPSRTPGGSSSGSAAAVAAGVVPAALATQTAGSTIRPAAFCGVVGVKPTFGRVPVDGMKPLAAHLDTVGVIAVGGRDAELVLAVIAGEALPDTAVPGAPGPLRLGWWPGAAPAVMERPAAAIVTAAVAGLAASDGIVVDDVELPGWFGDLVEAQRRLMQHEIWHALEADRVGTPDLLSGGLAAFLSDGPDPTGASEALALADRGRRALGTVLARYDAILTPAVVGEAPDAATTGDPVFCRTWTLLGVPAVAVPGLRGPEGLPLGVQLIGRPGRDAELVAAADRLASRLADL